MFRRSKKIKPVLFTSLRVTQGNVEAMVRGGTRPGAEAMDYLEHIMVSIKTRHPDSINIGPDVNLVWKRPVCIKMD